MEKIARAVASRRAPMKRLAVVHLIRKRNGLEPARRFLSSYRSFDPGIEHELVLLFKGFGADAERAPYRELAEGLRYHELGVPDRGFDVTAYWAAAETLEYERYCFLNSFSEVCADRWLEKLYHGAIRRGIGVAGATGSYQSFLPASLRSYLAISRRVHHRGPIKDLLMFLPFAHELNYLRRKLLHGLGFDPFPNYHVRTNAFILERELMRRAVHLPIQSKADSYRFESGRTGLTRQLLDKGLDVLVAGADGECYRKEDWHRSNTFWQSRQENLLVADNQTRQYAQGSDELRKLLSHLAWGELARPA